MISSSLSELRACFQKPHPKHYWHHIMQKQCALNASDEKIQDLTRQIFTRTGIENPFRSKQDNLWTPMHVAALTGFSAGIRFLMAHGACDDQYEKDAFGYTPIDYCRMSHPEVLSYMTPHLVDKVALSLLKHRVALPEGAYGYRPDSHEFGMQINTLMLSTINPKAFIGSEVKQTLIARNLEKLCEELGIKIIRPQRIVMVRDLWIRHGEQTLSSPCFFDCDPTLLTEIQSRIRVLSQEQSISAFSKTSHKSFQNMMGQTHSTIPLAIKDSLDLSGFPGISMWNMLPFYMEGGNYYLLPTGDKIKLIMGGHQLLTSLLLCKLTGQSEDFTEYLAAIKKAASTAVFSPLEKFIHAFELNFLGLMPAKEPDASDETTASIFSQTAIEYLLEKQAMTRLIANTFKVGLRDIIFLPQCAYHLDMFMRSGPKGSIFLQDYILTCSILLSMKEQADELGLSEEDLGLLERYINTAKSLSEELAPLFEPVQMQLTDAGFIVIPTPGVFYDVSHDALPEGQKTEDANFINSITGYSPATERYYYITMGTAAGTRLGVALMEMYRAFVQSYQPNTDVHFVGYDPENPTDFSESRCWANSLVGLHCLSVEVETKAHMDPS